MIKIVRASVAMSIQDLGRPGYSQAGHCRSGAMDRASHLAASTLAGATASSATIEMGPGPCTIDVLAPTTIAFAGAPRRGAPWWTTLQVSAGDSFEMSACIEGVWSYLGLAGGVAAPMIMGSRSACVREGIGRWLTSGDSILSMGPATEPQDHDPLTMKGPVRVYGQMESSVAVGPRTDRMGYELKGDFVAGGEELSEPVAPGFVQALPSGDAIALMSEAPTLGGYPTLGIVHPDDLRLIAQATAGQHLQFVKDE